jgi:hypothetical protein
MKLWGGSHHSVEAGTGLKSGIVWEFPGSAAAVVNVGFVDRRENLVKRPNSPATLATADLRNMWIGTLGTERMVPLGLAHASGNVFLAQRDMDQVPDDVDDGAVHFLDAVDAVGRDDETVVRQVGKTSAILA